MENLLDFPVSIWITSTAVLVSLPLGTALILSWSQALNQLGRRWNFNHQVGGTLVAVYEINHPLVKHKLGLMREEGISTRDFRNLTAEIARILTYEATRDLELETAQIRGWAEDVTVERVKGLDVTIVPILRAGLGMMEGALDMLPAAKISVVGLFRDKRTLEPHCYYQKLAPRIEKRLALIVDPMLATGGSFVAAVDLLRNVGCPKMRGLFLVAAPEGIERVRNACPDVDLYIAGIDERLDEQGYILPGLGDAGDKIFGTQ